MPLEHALLYPFLTIGAFYASTLVYEKTGKIGILQPVLIAIVVLATMLIMLGIPYAEYAKDMQFFSLLLTPAIVALAVPLYQNLKKARKYLHIILASMCLDMNLPEPLVLPEPVPPKM